MIYTYVDMYIAFVTPVRNQLETETRSKNGCGKQHFGQVQDNIESRAEHLHQEFLGVFNNLNSRVVLFSDLLILFYLTQNQLAHFLLTQSTVLILYLDRVLYQVRSPWSAVRSPCLIFILTCIKTTTPKNLNKNNS